MVILKTTDFTGYWAIATNNKTEATLQEALDIFEVAYLERLLGKRLSDFFVADLLNGIPQGQIYQDIFYQFTDDKGNLSKGIKNMLKGFIFYEYIMANQAFHSQSGVGINAVDTTAVQSFENAVRYAEIRYNDSLETFYTIQAYIKLHKGTCGCQYSFYDGLKVTAKYSSIL